MNFNLLAKAASEAASKLTSGTSSEAGGGGGGIGSTLLMVGYIALIGGVMYFVMIRPNRKRKKDEEKLRTNLQVGDEIVTIGGVYGRIVSLKDDTVVIESGSDRSKQMIAKWAIQTNNTIHDE